MKNRRKMNWRTVSITLGSFILISLLVFCLAPVKEVPYYVTIQRQITETYYETEPYKVPQSVELYQILDSYYDYIDTLPNNDMVYNFGVMVKNISNSRKGFQVRFTFNIYDTTEEVMDEVILSPNSFRPAEVIYLIPKDAIWTWSYSIFPHTEITYITKYRQVERERLVWKPFTETRYKNVSMLVYLTQY